MFKKIIHEPLVHFLLAGFLLFVYAKSCSTNNDLGDAITVDKEAMLNFMQYQSKAFNRAAFEEQFEESSETEKLQLIQNYVHEEALYREAVKLGLDQNDFVIKRRVIQKMEFILDDFDESTVVIHEDSLQVYFDQNKQRYFEAEQYTFTHVFFKNDEQNTAVDRAINFMKNEEHLLISATESLPYGDRFLYHRNYAEKSINFLEGQFGKKFTDALSTMDMNKKAWQGPISSDHGWHWIKLTSKFAASVPDLSTVYSTVKSDYLGHLKQQHKQTQIQKIVQEYDVVVDL